MGNFNEPWEIVYFNESNYVRDPVSRRSISDFILYILGVLVSWQAKAKKSVSLSSSEKEYVALSETVKGVMFVIQLLGSMKIAVEYPVMVRVDNVGAIFMASNVTTTCCTKHVDIRCKHINEYVKDKVVKIVFVNLLIMTASFPPKIQVLMRNIQRSLWARSLEMFLASKIF